MKSQGTNHCIFLVSKNVKIFLVKKTRQQLINLEQQKVISTLVPSHQHQSTNTVSQAHTVVVFLLTSRPLEPCQSRLPRMWLSRWSLTILPRVFTLPLRDAPLSKKCSFFEHCSNG